MNVTEAAQYLAVMLAPTVLVGCGLMFPRAVGAVHRRMTRRRARDTPPLSHPPIEQVAADLRRLLERHETLKRSPGVAMRGRHLLALEAAIGDCAIDAARALDLPIPGRSERGVLPTPEVRRLLRALTDAGLVLAPKTGLLAADGHS